MNQKYLIGGIVAIIIIAGVFLLSRSSSSPTNTSTNPVETQPSTQGTSQVSKAPNFSLKDYSGKLVSLSDFSGKPLVINSWATWCPFCKDELPLLAKGQKQFKDKVVVIAVDRAEGLDLAKKYTDDAKIANDMIFLLDPQDSFYNSINGRAMPETIFVDKNGNITDHKIGPLTDAELTQKIQALLQ